MNDRIRDTIRQANDSGVSLLFTDLQLAQTMLDRAELASDGETQQRNLEHAARACQSIRHFMGKLSFNEKDERALNEKLRALETRLRQLRPE